MFEVGSNTLLFRWMKTFIYYSDLILGTFRLEGARLFWSMMTRLQLESHPIVCWKFCYVMHRVLRDGHRHVSSKNDS
jgi:hypothetical protein